MPSIIDLGDLSERVEVRPGKFLEVTGVSALGLRYLLTKYPELRMMMTGLEANVGPEKMMDLLPNTISSIIAVGMGNINKPDEETAAAKLSIGTQLEVLKKIWEVSFPRGLASFIEALQAIAGELEGSDLHGKVPVMKSAEPSNGASQTVTPEPGPTLPGN